MSVLLYPSMLCVVMLMGLLVLGFALFHSVCELLSVWVWLLFRCCMLWKCLVWVEVLCWIDHV